jgi:hypothetical protein
MVEQQAKAADLKKEGAKVAPAQVDGDKKLYLDEPTGEMVSKK